MIPTPAITVEAIERTRAYVLASSIPEEAKDSLQGVLDAARTAVNGAPDKQQAMAEAIASFICHAARQEVRQPERIRAEIAAHVGCCPWRRGWMVFKLVALVVLTLVAPNALELLRLMSAQL